MIRIVLAAWFSLLLVGMQHELLVHEVDHLRAKVQRGNDASVQTPAADCVECALLASGSSAAPVSDHAQALRTAVAAAPVSHSESLLAVAPPAFYRSRAPPVLL